MTRWLEITLKVQFSDSSYVQRHKVNAIKIPATLSLIVSLSAIKDLNQVWIFFISINFVNMSHCSLVIAFLRNSTRFSSPFTAPSGLSLIDLDFSQRISAAPISEQKKKLWMTALSFCAALELKQWQQRKWTKSFSPCWPRYQILSGGHFC